VLQFAGLRLGEGFAKAEQRELASSTICEAVNWAETRGRILNFIDSLRVKGEILNLMMPVGTSEGETCLLKSVSASQDVGLGEARSAKHWNFSGPSLAAFPRVSTLRTSFRKLPSWTSSDLRIELAYRSRAVEPGNLRIT
jgi:hypothetical protein